MSLTEAHDLLDMVDSPSDLKKLSLDQLPEFCNQLRSYIIKQVAVNPGHLGSSLGAIELAVAIHYVFDTPKDKVIWDVGHQAYAHKIITGRKKLFSLNRKWNGLSGFPKMDESEYDAFGAGHASNSISAAIGIATGARLKGEKNQTIAVIGDGAMTGGLAFEAINNHSQENILVILNDNQIAIDQSVGALNDYLLDISTSKKYNRFKDILWTKLESTPNIRKVLQRIGNTTKNFILRQGSFFESFGFRYFGPTNGNNVISLVKRLNNLKNIDGPKILHIITTKGQGYEPAEKNPTEWHAPGKFNPYKGEQIGNNTDKLKYQHVFGYTLLEIARQNQKIIGITPAMPTGSSLNIMMKELPERVFDVGIAEGHSVTFAAGLATTGYLPFCSIYSTFSQRAIDNIIHDAALQKLEIVLCLDRAGLVGEDGATHQGAFDIPLLRAIPNVIITAPSSAIELRNLMYTASLGGYNSVFAIRYPRGHSFDKSVLSNPFSKIPLGKGRIIHKGTENVALISVGPMLSEVQAAIEKTGKDITLVDLRFIKPLDQDLINDIASTHRTIITVEDGTVSGGAGSAIAEYLLSQNMYCSIHMIGIPDKFIEQGSVAEQRSSIGMDTNSIADTILSHL